MASSTVEYTHKDCSITERYGRGERRHCGRVTIPQHLHYLQIAVMYCTASTWVPSTITSIIFYYGVPKHL